MQNRAGWVMGDFGQSSENDNGDRNVDIKGSAQAISFWNKDYICGWIEDHICYILARNSSYFARVLKRAVH